MGSVLIEYTAMVKQEAQIGGVGPVLIARVLGGDPQWQIERHGPNVRLRKEAPATRPGRLICEGPA